MWVSLIEERTVIRASSPPPSVSFAAAGADHRAPSRYARDIMTTRLLRRPLGATGLDVAPLGLAGSYGIDADATERAFHELGINYFFVSRRMPGLLEGVRRLVASGHRDEIVIATGANAPFGWSVTRAFDKAAKELGVDTIDVFHLFWVQAHWYVTGKTWPAMRSLQESGKVKKLAISCHDRPMARALVDELCLDVMMIRYNAAHRGAETDIFATLGPRRCGVVAYTATRWGRLLKPAGDLGPMSPEECYRFALGNPSVDVVLCGARSYEELAQNVEGVLGGPLVAERLDEIKRFGDAVRATASGRFGFSGA
jgi:aryl-alcohol dehydrogenase-like predicted oxidoreductase